MSPTSVPQKNWRFTPEGDACIIIRFSHEGLDTQVSQLCLQAAQSIGNAGLPGINDIVPAFNCVGVHYRASCWGKAPFQNLCQTLDLLLAQPHFPPNAAPEQTVDIPVCYDPEFGIDLEPLARTLECSTEQLIAMHTSRAVRVFMLGFAPGMPYMGLLDRKMDVPRLATPRLAIPAGSVAIANRQTIIYPQTSPGGWHIIGRTPIALFNPESAPHTLLAPGDTVRFKAISKEMFTHLKNSRHEHPGY
ncbi:allophanate hydrolase [Advenella faeciporci]|uniref:Allophanate hydrolase n=1 Tax=Advenella faeciporci TaxID=797535 RepID=A0A918MY89_9BURK|nr:5-oxoprolinase subunit PxpB [Advenella faeciporci]GGW87265.1 allophanate hydrolase [Advenella faeciporci]